MTKALALALLLAAPAGAMRPITPAAPEFPVGDAWVNAVPLNLAMMKDRKVVLIVFLNPTGLHSLRLLPVVESWFDRYVLRQLMVIGVLTPDLEVQKDAVWAKAELKRIGVDFPVILDSDRRLWKAYENSGWPATFLLDRKMHVVFDRLGEGDYAEYEGEIRDALYDLTTDPLPPPVNAPEPSSKNCGHATEDVDMGTRSKVRPRPYDAELAKKLLLVESRQGELTTQGKWDQETDGMRLAQKNSAQNGIIRLIYVAPQTMAVLAPVPGKKTRFFIKRDDQWLYEGIAGKDVKYDDDGRSYILVDVERLYDLSRDAGDKPHEISVIPEDKGAGVYGFSFADACTATNLP